MGVLLIGWLNEQLIGWMVEWLVGWVHRVHFISWVGVYLYLRCVIYKSIYIWYVLFTSLCTSDISYLQVSLHLKCLTYKSISTCDVLFKSLYLRCFYLQFIQHLKRLYSLRCCICFCLIIQNSLTLNHKCHCIVIWNWYFKMHNMFQFLLNHVILIFTYTINLVVLFFIYTFNLVRFSSDIHLILLYWLSSSELLVSLWHFMVDQHTLAILLLIHVLNYITLYLSNLTLEWNLWLIRVSCDT